MHEVDETADGVNGEDQTTYSSGGNDTQVDGVTVTMKGKKKKLFMSFKGRRSGD